MRENDWNDPEWRHAARSWITDRLAAHGTPLTGKIEEFRVRPWSVTLRAPSSAGPRWFKANITDCRYEAPLAAALALIVPGATLAPLDVDVSRGWLLTADSGCPTLRDAEDAGDRIAAWTGMLQSYALLQRTTVGRTAALVASGVPNLEIDLLPGILAEPDNAAHLAPGVEARFGEWCAELAADGIPAAVQHDDLHDDNVFADGRFFDWGDASISHPFVSLLVALNVARNLLDAPDGDPRLARLRDAYLEPWSDLAAPATLRRSATLACRVGRLSRALAWQRALHNAGTPVEPRFRSARLGWLASLPTPTTI